MTSACFLMVAVLGAWQVAAAATFDVATFGAQGDGIADDRPGIDAAIEAAISAGPGNTVRIPAGRYNLMTTRADRGAYFTIDRRASGLVITGVPGMTVLLVGRQRPFAVDRARDTVIRNLVIEPRTLNLTQGRITAANAPARQVTVTIDPGYAPPDSPEFRGDSRKKPKMRVLYGARATFTWEGELDIERATPAGTSWTVVLQKSPPAGCVGRRFFIWGDLQGTWSPFVELRDCAGFSAENIIDYAGGGFSGGGDSGTIRFTDCYAGPPPGSDRLGFYAGHQGHSRADVVLTNCRWLSSNDDGVNELTTLLHVQAHPRPDAIRIQRTSDYRIGDEVAIWDMGEPAKAHVRDLAKIIAIADGPDTTIDVQLDRPVTIARTGPQPDHFPRWDILSDRVVDLSSGGSWTLRDCTLTSSFAHPLLLKSAKGITVERCRIYGSDMSGFCGGMQTFWDEGPQCRHVTIRNNVFFDIDGVSCFLGIEVPGGISTASRDQLDITIEDNVFLSGGNHPVWNGISPRGVAVVLGNVRGAVVRRNLFSGFANANLVIAAAEDVSVTENIFSESHDREFVSDQWPRSAHVLAGSLISIGDSARVSLAGNLRTGAGAFFSTAVGVGAGTDGIRGQDDGIATARMAVYQAGQAQLSGGRLSTGGKTSGAGYATDLVGAQRSLTFTVEAAAAGTVPVIITYDNASLDAGGFETAAFHRLVINGDQATAMHVRYPSTAAWGRFDPRFQTMIWVALERGRNTLRFSGESGDVAIGSLRILEKP